MENAHLRFGTMTFHKEAGNSVSRFSLRMDRFIGERNTGEIGDAHFVSVIGGDAQIAAASAIVSDQQNFTVEGPGLLSMHVTLGRNAQVYRASIPLSTSKRPLKHLIALSEEFMSTANVETTGRTLLADASADFLWTSLAQIVGLPAVPEWAEWFYARLDDNLAIQPLFGLGLRPVAVTGTKSEFLRWLSEGIRKGEIRLPETNGPPAWPAITLEQILTSPSGMTETVQ